MSINNSEGFFFEARSKAENIMANIKNHAPVVQAHYCYTKMELAEKHGNYIIIAAFQYALSQLPAKAVKMARHINKAA